MRKKVVDKPISKPTVDPDGATFTCTCCGGTWASQVSHFYKNHSPIYVANNGYVTVCKSCMEKEYLRVADLLDGDEIRAVRYMCHRYDWYFNQEIAECATPKGKQTLFSAYIQQKNPMKQYKKEFTFMDTVKEDLSNVNQFDVYAVEPDEPVKITKKMIEHWPMSTPEEQVILESHYQMLHNANPECTGNQETYIKDLCYLNMMKMHALKSNDSDSATKLMDSYQKTFKASGLKMVAETDGSENETYGVTLSLISQMTPEEYYKDKTLFRDYTGIGEYYQRFIERPVRNIVTGSQDRDPQYHVYGDVPGEEDDEK